MSAKRGGTQLGARSLALLALGLLVLLLAWSASGQTKKKGGKEAKEDKAAAAADAGAAEAAAPAPEAGVDDEEPPPRPAQASDAGRISPLTPEADEFPDGGVGATPKDFDKLMGDIAALRSRVSALTTTLFASKLKVQIQTEGDDARIASLALTVDDGIVFRAPKRFVAEDEKVIYEHGVAPGHHVVGVEIERFDARGKQFKTWQASKFSVIVPEKKTLEVTLVLEDDSDMAEDFPDDQEGEYDLSVQLLARVLE